MLWSCMPTRPSLGTDKDLSSANFEARSWRVCKEYLSDTSFQRYSSSSLSWESTEKNKDTIVEMKDKALVRLQLWWHTWRLRKRWLCLGMSRPASWDNRPLGRITWRSWRTKKKWPQADLRELDKNAVRHRRFRAETIANPPWTPRRALARGRIQSNGPPKTALRHEAAPKLAEHYHQWCKSQWDSKDPEVQLEAISTNDNKCLLRQQTSTRMGLPHQEHTPCTSCSLGFTLWLQDTHDSYMRKSRGNSDSTSRVLRLHHNQEIDAILYNVNDLPSKDGMLSLSSN